MTITDAIKNRHSVRSYTDQPIPGDIIATLNDEIVQSNQESELNIQLITDEPKAFTGIMAHYGKFRGVMNYIALIGKKSPSLEEKIGWYGERLVIKAQQLGLNTCWVVLTFSRNKTACKINRGEKLISVISLGYGVTQGVPHKNKAVESLYQTNCETPIWFKTGMDMAILAPTTFNQQKFLFTLTNNRLVSAKSTGGFYSQVDLGIVKYHFEVGAGKENFDWE